MTNKIHLDTCFVPFIIRGVNWAESIQPNSTQNRYGLAPVRPDLADDAG